MKRLIFTMAFFSSFVRMAYAQSVANAGWLFISNSHQLSKKFDLLTDVQLRSADQFKYLNTLLLRGALNYNITKKNALALGYAYKADWEHKNGEHTFSPEHRIYEQYLYEFKAGRTELNLRTRLEQRFVKDDAGVSYSQRLRAFISAQIPLIADTGFTTGLYTGIQNESFFNVQNKHKVNDDYFDQNRSFFSLGYRFNRQIDAEFGYMYWTQRERDGSAKTNVWQLMVTTKF